MDRSRRFKLKIILAILCFILAICLFALYFYIVYFMNNDITVKEVSYNSDLVSISFNEDLSDYYCKISSTKEKGEWKKIEDNTCEGSVLYFENYRLYVKKDDEIKKVDFDGVLLDFNVSKTIYYLAVSGTSVIKPKIKTIGNFDRIDYSIDDESILKVDYNKITGVKPGVTDVSVFYKNGSSKIRVRVTDLIDKVPYEYNFDRDYIPCDAFSEEEGMLLDRILASRIKDAGYGTRAGVVAAARFLTLEFPYRIKYFSENGRLANYNGGPAIDGEGRYYHKGLYLNYSKTEEMEKVDKGPAPWGCSIYSRPSKGMRANGLDCSGFTTWAVLNGGFDIEDLGAHGAGPDIHDLNDIGEEVSLTKELALSDEIKAGDLLGEVTVTEGHSALVVGIDKNYYYIAESLWITPNGVNINKYRKDELASKFETVNLMDSYYEKQGNYTSMWR